MFWLGSSSLWLFLRNSRRTGELSGGGEEGRRGGGKEGRREEGGGRREEGRGILHLFLVLKLFLRRRDHCFIFHFFALVRI